MLRAMKARSAVLLVALVGGCTHAPAVMVTDQPLGDPGRRERPAPLVLDAITATATGELLTLEAVVARLGSARLVFVGESHTNADIHEAQRRLIAALAASKRPVLVGLEMFPYTEQPALDRWNRGEGTEDEFVRQSHWYKHWGFDWRYYREIFLLRERGVRFYGVNAPREVVSAVRKKGFDKLTPEEAAHIPAKIDTTSDEHRRLFRSYFGAGDATHAAGLSEAAVEGMFQAQCTWDATMAWNAVRALEAAGDPTAVMVVLLGSGHAAFGLGAQRQAAQYSSAPRATVMPIPLIDEEGHPARVRASYADYLWALPAESPLAPYPTVGVTLSDRKEVPHPVISAVAEQSPAAAAGLQAEDRVISFDGAPVPDKETFLALLSRKSWGDGVALVVERAGKSVSVSVALRRKT
jgi:aminopeptidase N